MSKLSSIFVYALFGLLVISTVVFAQSDWIIEWYSLDPVRDTGTHENGIAVDWLDRIFGRPEASLSEFGGVPGLGVRGEGGLGWFVGNIWDINDDRNLSNGIYEGKYGDMSNYVFYGIVAVISPRAQDTVMHVAQDDELKVWINGKLVATNTSSTGGPMNTRPHDVHLDAGVNVMLVKVSEQGGKDYLNVRFDAENLGFNAHVFDIEGLSVSPESNLSTTWGGLKSSLQR